MVSVPSKFSRCAQPPMMLCSTHVQPRNPKSCSRLPRSGEAVPCTQQGCICPCDALFAALDLLARA